MAYFNRIDAETEVAYELIAEPVQEPSAREPQPGEAVDQAPGAVDQAPGVARRTLLTCKASPGA